jgi:acetylornithine deacetylase/succinyl-diaminopimelate desuccinylase-like protein
MGEVFSEVAGHASNITGFTSGCDFPYLTRYAGMPGVIFGPGNATLAHTSSEQVELADVLAAGKTLAQVILRWCGV